MPKVRMPKGDIAVPDNYFKLNSAPGDPPCSIPLGSESSGYQAFIMVYPIHMSEAMPFGHPQTLISGIHNQLDENQGLIAVKEGKTKIGRNFMYSIIKSFDDKEIKNQYNLTLHIFYDTYAVNITGFFDEAGVTGVRETQAYIALRNEGIIAGRDDWCKDPYDANYIKGHLMNRSEDERFDAVFPEHPLSEARRFASFIITNN